MVGRLLFDKGIREFIDAAYNVKQKYPHVIFKIVGDCDPQNPASLSEKDKKNIHDEGLITVTGFDANVLNHLSTASVLVLPSYREGVPLVVQEAMAMGRPIITTDVPGCRDTIEDGISGYYVPPFNAQQLAEKMMLFCEKPELIKTMGKKAYERAALLFNRIDKDNSLIEWLLT
jgi:glycosyltransferase involved in cell wall biosynthesis